MAKGKTKDDIRKERQDAEARVAELRKAEAEYDDKRKAELRDEFEEKIKAEGFTLADIFGAGAGKAKGKGGRTKGEPKFKDPETGKTWTGKGRQPEWFKAHVETGGKPEDLAI